LHARHAPRVLRPRARASARSGAQDWCVDPGERRGVMCLFWLVLWVFRSLGFAAWGFGTLGGVRSLGVRIFGLRCLGVRNFGSTVFWLAGYLGSAHLDLRLSVWMFAAGRMVLRFFLGSHGTVVAVSAPFMMPLRDSGHSNECSLYVL